MTLSAMMQATSKQTSTPAKGALQLKEISIIPITAAPSNAAAAAKGHRAIVEKATSSNQSMTDDESADSLRKKRCTDRYDSSESSDR